jgi:hypothetical protein
VHCNPPADDYPNTSNKARLVAKSTVRYARTALC